MRETGIVEHECSHGHAWPSLLKAETQHLYRFTFLRHPVAWYRSLWQFRLSKWGFDHYHKPWRILPEELIPNHRIETFSEFVRWVAENKPGTLSRWYSLYVRGCDFVGQQEQLRKHLAIALGNAGESFSQEQLQRMNRENESRKRAEVTPEIEQIILSHEQEALKLWTEARHKAASQ